MKPGEMKSFAQGHKCSLPDYKVIGPWHLSSTWSLSVNVYTFIIPFEPLEYLPYWQNHNYSGHCSWIPSLWVFPHYFLPKLLRDFSEVAYKAHQGLEKRHFWVLVLFFVFFTVSGLMPLFSNHNRTFKITPFYLKRKKKKGTKTQVNVIRYFREWFSPPGTQR